MRHILSLAVVLTFLPAADAGAQPTAVAAARALRPPMAAAMPAAMRPAPLHRARADTLLPVLDDYGPLLYCYTETLKWRAPINGTMLLRARCPQGSAVRNGGYFGAFDSAIVNISRQEGVYNWEVGLRASSKPSTMLEEEVAAYVTCTK